MTEQRPSAEWIAEARRRAIEDGDGEMLADYFEHWHTPDGEDDDGEEPT